jgi:hypothetical protein
MEIEVKVTATTEVAVDGSVTPVDGRFPGPPGAPRYRFVFSDDLPRGQVIVQGVALFDVNFDPLKPLTFAIVGGTGAYEGASGQAIQSGPDGSIRTLKIVL